MFATMNTVHAPDSFFGKIKYNLLPPPVKTEVIRVPGGSDFLHLTVPVIRGKIYWENVRRSAGEAGKHLLLPGGVPSTESVKFKAFHPDRFLPILTFRSFLRLLSLLPEKELFPECVLVDFPASLTTLACALPRCCRTVKVLTGNAEKYRAFADTAMEQFGCAVCIGSDVTKTFHSPIVLIPGKIPFPMAFSKASIVIAGDPAGIYAEHLLTPEGVSLPAEYLRLMPAGINPLHFAAALYEISGVGALSKCTCPVFRDRNRILTYQEVISMLDY